jgi:DHA1 family tetracycline resistance protein-like MFS transporter
MTLTLFTHNVLGFNEKMNSYLFVFVGIMTVIVQGGFIRRIKGKPYTLLMIGIFLITTALALLAFVHTPWQLYVVTMLFPFGFGITNVYLPTLLSIQSEKDPEGEIMGALESMNSLARVLGPILISTLLVFGFTITYITAAAISLCGMIVLFASKKVVSVKY